MKKFWTIFFVFLAIVVFASWQYRLLCILMIVIINRKWLKGLAFMQKWKHSYKFLIISLLVLIYASLPNYFQRGRTQLHYLNTNGKRANTPALVYIANIIFPEKEVMNLCYKSVAILPIEQMRMKIAGKSYRIDELVRDAHNDFWKGRAFGFYNAYNHLYLSGSNPGSFVYGQVCNQLFNQSYDAVYITKPKHYDKEKTYPLVIFCHGYMGSWELYQGILNGLDDCIVMSIGTKGLDGLSFSIRNLFTKYIPYLQSLGYNIDLNQLHLMGLSNGGQASNAALRSQYYSAKFKTIAFISTPCNVIKNSHAKVLLIGGGKDGSAVGQPSTAKRLRQQNTIVESLYDPDENHYIFATKRREVVRFLNEQLQ